MATELSQDRAATVIQRLFRRVRPKLEQPAQSNISSLRERIQLLKKRHEEDPIKQGSFAREKERRPLKTRVGSKEDETLLGLATKSSASSSAPKDTSSKECKSLRQSAPSALTAPTPSRKSVPLHRRSSPAPGVDDDAVRKSISQHRRSFPAPGVEDDAVRKSIALNRRSAPTGAEGEPMRKSINRRSSPGPATESESLRRSTRKPPLPPPPARSRNSQGLSPRKPENSQGVSPRVPAENGQDVSPRLQAGNGQSVSPRIPPENGQDVSPRTPRTQNDPQLTAADANGQSVCPGAPDAAPAAEDGLTNVGSVDLRKKPLEICTADSPRQSIMSFLDAVDKHMRTESIVTPCATPATGSITVDTFRKMKSKISLLQLEVEDKRQIIVQLRGMFDDQKARTAAAETTAAVIWEQKLKKVKEDGDRVCERQLKMCDRLMKDKAQLTAKCSQLAEDINALRRQFDTKVEEMQQAATKDIAKQRTAWAAQEKTRREQWEKDRTKEIKEMTIKGLEPEVEKMFDERKHERRRLEEQHFTQMENLRAEMQQLTATKVRETKELMHMEHEAAIEKDHETSRQKMREEREKYEQALNEERAKCASDLQQQERLAQQERMEMQHRAMEQQKKALVETEERFEERIRALKQKITQGEDSHEEELKQHRVQVEQRKVELEQGFDQRLEEEKGKIERELKEKFTRERDAQLEAVVDKLGREAFEKERALYQKIEDRAEELKKEHKIELRQQKELVRSSEMETIEATKEKRLAESYKEFLEKEIQILKQEKDQLGNTLDSKAAALAASEEEILQLKKSAEQSTQSKERALAESRQREMEAVRKANEQLSSERKEYEREKQATKEREQMMMGSVEDRIKRSLAAKDEQIAELKDQLAASECSVDEFKYMLQRQRQELLGKMT